MISKDDAYEYFWNKVILQAIKRCDNDADEDFKTNAELESPDSKRYKEELKVAFENKQEWLSKKYLSSDNEPSLDFHKLGSILCRCIVGVKHFSFNEKKAVSMFKELRSNPNIERSTKMKWEINNIYINYKLAFLVYQGVLYLDLLFWAERYIDKIKKKYEVFEISSFDDDDAETIRIFSEFIDRVTSKKQLCDYRVSSWHDNFAISQIIALMKNDKLMRDFDYLQYSINAFQWQEYTKSQIFYEILLQEEFEKVNAKLEKLINN